MKRGIFGMLLACALCSIASTAYGAVTTIEYDGVVTSVHDGDTITVLQKLDKAGTGPNEVVLYQSHNCRAGNIDAPELTQPYGKEAQKLCSDLCLNKTVHVVAKLGLDTHGREITTITIPGTVSTGNISTPPKELWREIVKGGYAFWYQQYSKDATFGVLQDQAARSGVGMWAGLKSRDPSKMVYQPWDWRKKKYTGAIRTYTPVIRIAKPKANKQSSAYRTAELADGGTTHETAEVMLCSLNEFSGVTDSELDAQNNPANPVSYRRPITPVRTAVYGVAVGTAKVIKWPFKKFRQTRQAKRGGSGGGGNCNCTPGGGCGCRK